jgi:hypothetical protein
MRGSRSVGWYVTSNVLRPPSDRPDTPIRFVSIAPARNSAGALAVVSWSIRNVTSAGWFTTSCRYGPAGSRRNVVLVSGNVGDATT